MIELCMGSLRSCGCNLSYRNARNIDTVQTTIILTTSVVCQSYTRYSMPEHCRCHTKPVRCFFGKPDATVQPLAQERKQLLGGYSVGPLCRVTILLNGSVARGSSSRLVASACPFNLLHFPDFCESQTHPISSRTHPCQLLHPP